MVRSPSQRTSDTQPAGHEIWQLVAVLLRRFHPRLAGVGAEQEPLPVAKSPVAKLIDLERALLRIDEPCVRHPLARIGGQLARPIELAG